jgi:hypothetical protein
MDPIASAGSSIIDVMSHRTGLPRYDYSFFLPNDTMPSIVSLILLSAHSDENNPPCSKD